MEDSNSIYESSLPMSSAFQHIGVTSKKTELRDQNTINLNQVCLILFPLSVFLLSLQIKNEHKKVPFLGIKTNNKIMEQKAVLIHYDFKNHHTSYKFAAVQSTENVNFSCASILLNNLQNERPQVYFRTISRINFSGAAPLQPVNSSNCPIACLMNISSPLTTKAPVASASCKSLVHFGV